MTLTRVQIVSLNSGAGIMPEKASSREITLIAFEITSVTSGLILLCSGSLIVSEWPEFERVASWLRREGEVDMFDCKESTMCVLCTETPAGECRRPR